jgi:hypothetical protein
MERRNKPRVTVPVGEAVLVAYRAVLLRPGLVLERGWLPLLAMLAALLLPGLVLGYAAPAGARPVASLDIATLIEALVAVLALNAFAVRWHQMILLGAAYPVPRRRFAWAWLRFIAYTALIYAAAAGYAGFMMLAGLPAAGGPLAAVLDIAAALFGLALSLAIARLSLLYPAAACGTPLGIVAAWRLMRGNSWRLIGASLLAVLPLLLLTGLLLGRVMTAAHVDAAEALSAGPMLGLFLLSGVVEALLRLLLVALSATILADFYRRLLAARKQGEKADA